MVAKKKYTFGLDAGSLVETLIGGKKLGVVGRHDSDLGERSKERRMIETSAAVLT